MFFVRRLSVLLCIVAAIYWVWKIAAAPAIGDQEKSVGHAVCPRSNCDGSNGSHSHATSIASGASAQASAGAVSERKNISEPGNKASSTDPTVYRQVLDRAATEPAAAVYALEILTACKVVPTIQEDLAKYRERMPEPLWRLTMEDYAIKARLCQLVHASDYDRAHDFAAYAIKSRAKSAFATAAPYLKPPLPESLKSEAGNLGKHEATAGDKAAIHILAHRGDEFGLNAYERRVFLELEWLVSPGSGKAGPFDFWNAIATGLTEADREAAKREAVAIYRKCCANH